MRLFSTDRLQVRWLCLEDAPFIVRLLNEPSWLRFIGDRGVRSLDDAIAYLKNGPLEMYRTLGYGLFMLEDKSNGVSIGLCGMLKRSYLPDADLGFAILEAFHGNGYAYEATQAVIQYARETLEIPRLAAITSLDNEISGKLLVKLGFSAEGLLQIPPDCTTLKLFVLDL